MKRLLLIFATLLSLSCVGQTSTNATNTQTLPVQVFMDRVIKLNTLAEGGYGYDILYQGRPVVSQTLNPFTFSPKGLSSKEDAFKVARWQVQQLATGTPATAISNQPLPVALAKQLNISLQ